MRQTEKLIIYFAYLGDFPTFINSFSRVCVYSCQNYILFSSSKLFQVFGLFFLFCF